jgi:hypothetical protein
VAYGLQIEKREELHRKVIQQYGPELELIAKDKVEKSKPRSLRRGKGKRN